jgi:hypothetical protein
VTFSSTGKYYNFSLDDFHFDTSNPTSNIAFGSFIRNGSTSSNNFTTTSNGDLDVNYSVSGASLTTISNLTYGVYWATGPSVADIIPSSAPPVASGTLNGSVGTHSFPITIANLATPPSQATYLVAVLDSHQVINEANRNAAIGVIPLSDPKISGPLSFELQTNTQTSAPPGLTREQRVFLWLQHNAADIKATATKYNIDPVAIAGAIAWEALQNVLKSSLRAVGPGKVHYWDYNPLAPDTVAAFVEGNSRYNPVLPVPKSSFIDPLSQRILILLTSNGSIEYIAAIMNAYATEVDIANRTTNAGFPSIRKSPGILATMYNGSSIHLSTAQADLAAKKAGGSTTFSTQGTTMGQWVAYGPNLLFLEAALGVSTP